MTMDKIAVSFEPQTSRNGLLFLVSFDSCLSFKKAHLLSLGKDPPTIGLDFAAPHPLSPRCAVANVLFMFWWKTVMHVS